MLLRAQRLPQTGGYVGPSSQSAEDRQGAPALEAYPVDRDLTPSSSWTGFASTFLKLGFKSVARRRPPRPIMRYPLQQQTRLR